MSAHLTATTPGQVLPPWFVFGCIGDGCSVGEHVLLPVGRDEVRQLMADGDDDVGPDAARWCPGK
ncbi:MAG: hypothetical protein ACRDTZ_00160 [Pseudonocardiaceae bacterium]